MDDGTSQDIEQRLDSHIPLQSLQRRNGIEPRGPPIYVVPHHYALQTAKDIFGDSNLRFEVKWEKTIYESKETTEDDRDEYTVMISLCLRVELRSGAFHEDIGVGEATNEEKFYAVQHARQMARYSATKRVLKLFGPALGGDLSDKELRSAYLEAEKLLMRKT